MSTDVYYDYSGIENKNDFWFKQWLNFGVKLNDTIRIGHLAIMGSYGYDLMEDIQIIILKHPIFNPEAHDNLRNLIVKSTKKLLPDYVLSAASPDDYLTLEKLEEVAPKMMDKYWYLRVD